MYRDFCSERENVQLVVMGIELLVGVELPRSWGCSVEGRWGRRAVVVSNPVV